MADCKCLKCACNSDSKEFRKKGITANARKAYSVKKVVTVTVVVAATAGLAYYVYANPDQAKDCVKSLRKESKNCFKDSKKSVNKLVKKFV